MKARFPYKLLCLSMALLFLFVETPSVLADNGEKLWLRQDAAFPPPIVKMKLTGNVGDVIRNELSAWKGAPVTLAIKPGTLAIKKMGGSPEAYSISFSSEEVRVVSPSASGLLYATYHLLRLQAQGNVPIKGTINESPAFPVRILNHWDNLDGGVERGYAGRSLWQWDSLPDVLSPRYELYARANASVGINGAVLNNVNANPKILDTSYLEKVKVLADIFRPYGIKMYLSVNFASPKVLGGLPTADPLDSGVQRWWIQKADEIYRLIPDFGGILVKANSEGQAGPNDYGRTHAEGANMLARAFGMRGGVVMWRAFVYNQTDEDRAKQAFQEFKPLDGEFLPNVIVQVKNGPIDFQPREPYSPLFGGLHHTPEMVEFQITQEYLGHANHLAYLAPMWKEFFDESPRGALSGVAGVANVGDDANWTGNDFAQANWYAFGRLAWNPDLSSEVIAREWLSQTFSTDENFLDRVAGMMLRSREAVVDYMMPMGLHHIFAVEHHYGPQPWFTKEGFRPDWTPPYYHNADKDGIGFNRTHSGSDAVSQYPEETAGILNDAATCPEKYLLWFHHLPWDFRMKSGDTLWDELCRHYQHGVDEVRDFQKIWAGVGQYVDEERHKRVSGKLRIQARDAMWWRDACIGYFSGISGKQLPAGVEPPLRSLEEIKAFELSLGICGNAPSGMY